MGAFWRCAVVPATLATMSSVVMAQATTTKLSDHVYVIPQGGPGARSNVGLVVGTKASLVIDSGLGPGDGQLIAGELRKVTDNTSIYVAATHFHPEHILGEPGFPASAIVLRSRAMQQDIVEKGAEMIAMFRQIQNFGAVMSAAAFRPSDVMFDGDMVLDLDGVRVQLLSLGPAHTFGDTGFFVEGDRILFSGDVAMSTPLGINAEGMYSSARTNVLTWLASLERMAALRPIRVVPSHGSLGDESMVEKHRTFLRALQDRVRDLKREGKSAADAEQILTPEMEAKFPAEVGASTSGTQVPRIAGAVSLLYAELP
jgi:glyoxylase-like metal-dependent hydrolase (beta-lactamase superfamily II)